MLVVVHTNMYVQIYMLQLLKPTYRDHHIRWWYSSDYRNEFYIIYMQIFSALIIQQNFVVVVVFVLLFFGIFGLNVFFFRLRFYCSTHCFPRNSMEINKCDYILCVCAKPEKKRLKRYGKKSFGLCYVHNVNETFNRF